MFQYIAAVVGAKIVYNRIKAANELKELRAYGESISFPYLGEKVSDYRKKLQKERDKRIASEKSLPDLPTNCFPAQENKNENKIVLGC